VAFPKAHFRQNLLLRNLQHLLQLRHLTVLLSHLEALQLQAERPPHPVQHLQALCRMNPNR
jgi:hypothetical protein